MAYIVLRIKGTVNVPYWAEKTMELLNLRKKYRATIVKEDSSIKGMLIKVKNYIAWYKADKELIKELIEKRGKIKDMNGFKSIDEIAEALANDSIKLSLIGRPWFGLNPPRGGFKRSTKLMYSEGGVCGENPELPSLIRRMI